MAVVVDEWGVFEGIVTIEDILEEIVGDIRDEFDRAANEPSIEKREDGTYVVDGGVSIEAVNDRLNASLKSDDDETIGGYIFSHLGRVPETGDEIEQGGCVLRVATVTDTRVTRVIIQPSQPTQEADEE